MQEKITTALRNKVLPHERNYIHSLGRSGKTTTERDYTKSELDALRQAVVNHEYVLNNVKNLDEKIQAVRDYIKKENGDEDTPVLARYKERVIDYPDYKQVYAKNKEGFDVPVNFNKFNHNQYWELYDRRDPNFFMQGTVGAGDYSIDDKGNVTFTDRYDFTQDNIGDGAEYTPLALLAKVAGKPYDIKINLGNINDWGMKYSGYNNMLEQADYIMNSPQYKLQQSLKAKGIGN